MAQRHSLNIFLATPEELQTIENVGSKTIGGILALSRSALREGRDITVEELVALNSKVRWQELKEDDQLLLTRPEEGRQTHAQFRGEMNDFSLRLSSLERNFGEHVEAVESKFDKMLSYIRETHERIFDELSEIKKCLPPRAYGPSGLVTSGGLSFGAVGDGAVGDGAVGDGASRWKGVIVIPSRHENAPTTSGGSIK